MLKMKMFCNIATDMPDFRERTKVEVEEIHTDRIRVRGKTKAGIVSELWAPRSGLRDFRYSAWFNGIREEFRTGKKLAKIATKVFLATNQDHGVLGEHSIDRIKELIDTLEPLASYYDAKSHRS